MKNKTGLIDVTNMVSEITWSGSQDEIARKLELNFLFPLHDYYAPKVYPNIGEQLFLYDDNHTELFQGRVFYNERLGEQGTIQITAYDDAIRLAKSKGTYNFKGKTAEAITQIVCNDLGVKIGQLAPTGIPQKMLCNGMGMYEIIQKAYAGASSQNKKKYSIGMRQGKLCVDEIGKEVVEIPISSDTNILESSYSENAEEVINRVKIYDEKDQYIGVVEDKELIDRVGIFQDVYTKEQDKQAGTVASNMLKGIEERIEITTLGNVQYRTGKVVKIQDISTKVDKVFCITDDSHKWNNSQYETNIGLDIAKI
ncbi:MAG: hypothetical protein E6590_16480 [Clostridiales bacterium]|uniref:XkdQ/YqbQ family protein n=1 Tax=Zhenhengia sp. TaxID=2944208 RepID=UPI00290B0E65|nr:hypothetical protein [Clostridiales bacterium]